MTRPGRALLPAQVARRVEEFAAAHARRLPGVVERVAVIGSAVAGDWQEGTSDIDLVLQVTRAVRDADLPTIADLHDPGAGRPIDGVYLTADQIDAGPDEVTAAPQVTEGVLDPAHEGGQLTWVTWCELHTAVEGVVGASRVSAWEPSTRRFPGSSSRLRAFSRANLIGYWAPLATATAADLRSRPDTDPVDAEEVRWLVLGAPRLVGAIAGGTVISKSHAAELAAVRWPEHGTLISRVVASRLRDDVRFTAADAREAVALVRRCVATVDVGPV